MAALVPSLRSVLRRAAGAPALQQRWMSASTGDRGVDELNQELDDFFGVSHSSGAASAAADPFAAAGPLAGGPASVLRSSPQQQLSRGYDEEHNMAAATTTAAAAASSLRTQASSSSNTTTSSSSGLTHVDATGRAAMVDVGGKESTLREARASCRVLIGEEAFALVQSNSLSKGDVLTVAQIAGIGGAKLTPQLIPLCHNLLLSKVDVQLSLDPSSHSVLIRSMARTTGPTGVEMEALTAAVVAGLTVYDMVKAVAKGAAVTDLVLDHKSGGKSGTFDRGQGAAQGVM